MLISTEAIKIGTLAVLVPLAVFVGNWVYRGRKEYTQTAAADFLLAVFIFDITVMLASHEFEPFLRSAELRPIVSYWHFVVGCIGVGFWLSILKWGEPKVAGYYKSPTTLSFPYGTFALCWMALFVVIALHVGFFVIKSGVDHA